jgi:PAS domain S-box-containing protein
MFARKRLKREKRYMTDQHPMEFWEDFQLLKKEVIKLRDTEKRLLDIKYRYDTLFQNGKDLYAVLDPEGRFTNINPYGLDLLGFNERDILGKSADEVFAEKQAHLVSHFTRDIVKTGQSLQFNWNVRSRTGKEVKFQAHLVPVRVNDDITVGAYLQARDISEIEYLKSELENEKNETGKLKETINNLTSQVEELQQKTVSDNPGEENN